MTMTKAKAKREVGSMYSWTLLRRTFSIDAKEDSTEAYEIPGVGCIVYRYIGSGNAASSSMMFVPDVKIVPDKRGENMLVSEDCTRTYFPD